MSSIKPGSTEATRLLEFLLKIGRPTNPQQEAEMMHWVTRLRGPK